MLIISERSGSAFRNHELGLQLNAHSCRLLPEGTGYTASNPYASPSDGDGTWTSMSISLTCSGTRQQQCAVRDGCTSGGMVRVRTETLQQ